MFVCVFVCVCLCVCVCVCVCVGAYVHVCVCGRSGFVQCTCITLRSVAMKQLETAGLLYLSNCKEICPFHGRCTFEGHLRGPNFGSTAIEAILLEIHAFNKCSGNPLLTKILSMLEISLQWKPVIINSGIIEICI